MGETTRTRGSLLVLFLISEEVEAVNIVMHIAQ
jgi:hypothetical protein